MKNKYMIEIEVSAENSEVKQYLKDYCEELSEKLPMDVAQACNLPYNPKSVKVRLLFIR